MGQGLAGWVEAEEGRFILWLPVAMGAAILAYFNLKAEPPLWLGLALCAAAAVALGAGWRWPPGRLGAALLLAAALGFARAEWRTAAMPPLMDVPYGVVPVSGVVAAVDVLPTGRRLTLAQVTMDDGPTQRRTLRIKLRADDPAPVSSGDAVTLRAMLFKPDRPAYPGGWESGRDAFFAGAGASGFAVADVTVTAAARHGQVLQRLREAIAARILAVLPVATGSIAVTLLTGFQQTIPASERQAFIAAGLAHLLAVAGLHVGIVMGLAFAAARIALSRHEAVALHVPGKAVAAVAALLAGCVYAALTGAHLPILRSLAMAALVTLGVLAGRRAVSLRGLALAAIGIMLMAPEAVVGVSFQMSFSAVLALIAGYGSAGLWLARLQERGRAGRWAGAVAALALTSFLAGAASMPFAAYQFQQVQPYWILANLIAVPLTAFWIMPCGLLALGLMPFGGAALALLPMGWGIAVVLRLATVIAAWPDASLRILPVPGVAILAVAFGLAWLCLWRTRLRFAGVAFMLAGLAIYAAARPPDVLLSPDARLIAVRQGHQVLLLRGKRASGFVLAQWQPVWAGRQMVPLDPAAPPAGVACSASGCLVGLVLLALAPPFDCQGAPVVVAAVPLRGACAAPGQVVLDRFSVWRDGAIALWHQPAGWQMVTDRMVEGARPWVMPWPSWTR